MRRLPHLLTIHSKHIRKLQTFVWTHLAEITADTESSLKKAHVKQDIECHIRKNAPLDAFAVDNITALLVCASRQRAFLVCVALP
jgi:hypothetical protein